MFIKVNTEEPWYDGINYLVILKVKNDYIYAFAYYDGEKWHTDVEGAEVVAFSETNPKTIIGSLPEEV